MNQKEVSITSDGITVWVNSNKGHCIARFGRMGIDIHTEDTKVATKCLHCTHKPTTTKDWEEFKAKMQEHYGLEIPESHKPNRFA